ncbi:Hypothetical predicted protein [Marmota monax]|uniref:Glutathione S-transferase Mu 4 n=1 Tax=Marmota monax TaxID=9995 RepID=A0A5E4BGE0_MARMO|nr:hypothetical protein GHT09_003576 [Marmota monax]VTJ68754.1 Hypothetical predicted protein [Marmota monax]
MPMILGYWDIRGLAHAIRLLLEYTDSNYEEKRYTMGDAPDYDRSQWLDEKFKLGLDFPNLPYLIDGPHRITQSNAILRYIARKHNLCEWGWLQGVGDGGCIPGLAGWEAEGGETEEEMIRVDILENQAMDIANELARVCYSPDFVSHLLTTPTPTGLDLEKLKPEYLERIPEALKLFSQFLGKKPWFVGDKITFVDFLAYDLLDLHRIFHPKCLDEFSNLKDFVSRFEGLKKISAYMKSSRFLPKPLYTKVATWGNK